MSQPLVERNCPSRYDQMGNAVMWGGGVWRSPASSGRCDLYYYIPYDQRWNCLTNSPSSLQRALTKLLLKKKTHTHTHTHTDPRHWIRYRSTSVTTDWLRWINYLSGKFVCPCRQEMWTVLGSMNQDTWSRATDGSMASAHCGDYPSRKTSGMWSLRDSREMMAVKYITI